jgi:curved DNA-binding protein CbpA
VTIDDERTHYDVVGVEPGASKDEIRSAYRARLGDLRAGDASSDRARAETARLNNAWQVLSDPFQRERYDRALGLDSEPPAAADETADEAGEDGGAAPRRTAVPPASAEGKRGGMLSTEAEPPPADWPPGFRPPPARARVIAMVIDLFVLAVIVFAGQALGARVIDSAYPEETDRLDALADQVDVAEARRDRAEERADDAEDAIERATRDGDAAALEEARGDKRAAEAEAERQQEIIDDKEDRAQDVQGDLLPAQLGVTVTTLVVALLYLVPSSARTGRTLGKRLLRIRAVQVNGAPLGVRAALLRYGTPLLVGFMLSPIFGQLGFFVVLVGVVTWPRNPNRQGLHDRLAGTIVVDG